MKGRKTIKYLTHLLKERLKKKMPDLRLSRVSVLRSPTSVARRATSAMTVNEIEMSMR